MKEFKHWLTATLAFFFLFFMMPGINSTSSLFVVPVTQELGMSRSLYSLTFSVLYIVQLIVSLFYGKIYKMVSLRTLLLILTTAAVASCIISALAQNIFMVFMGAVLRGVVMGLGMVPIAATIITNWFDKKRGLALGIVFASSGFGGMTLMKVFTLWVNSPDIGWRMAYFYIAVVIGAPMLIAALFLKATPEEAGLKPYGYNFFQNDSSQGNMELAGMTLREARKSSAFYMCILVVFLVCVTLNGIYLHLAAFFSDANVGAEQVGMVFSLIAVGIAAGKLLYGYISDRFGIAVTLSVTAVSNLISTTLFLTGSSGILLMAASVFFGLAIGVMQLLVGLLAGLFGKKDYSAIVGIFSAAMALAMAIGAYILGFVYDVQQTYTNIFIIYAIIVCVAAILSYFLKGRLAKN